VEFKTATSPHGIGPNSVTRVMGEVLLALVPGIAALVWFFGWGVVINIVIAGSAALLAEAAVLTLRKRPILPTLADLSALLTAVLLAISVPPTLPWWLMVLGVLFAIVIAKQLYGGLGYNPFNPAMAGYVLLLVSFPVDMTRWLPPATLAEHAPSFADSLNIILHGSLPAGVGWDALTGATPLDQMRTGLDQNRMIGEIRQNPLWGSIGAVGWEWVPAVAAHHQLAHPRRPAGRHVRHRRPVQHDRPQHPSGTAVSPVQRRHHAGCLLHRHRPGVRRHH
jgi:electron transport complex protein RnfD